MAGDKNIGRKRVIRKKIEMDDDKLIEMVRRNPSLYEPDHIKYASGTFRTKTWKAIGAELKRHPLFCKKRWGNIRDNYKKAMKKYNWKIEQGCTSMKKYKFCDKLDFLANQLDYNKEKESLEETSLEVKCEPDIDPNLDENTLFDNLNREEYYDDNMGQQSVEPLMTPQFNINQTEDEDQTQQFDNCSNSQADTRVSEFEEEDVEIDNQVVEAEKLLTPKIEIVTNPVHLTTRTKRKLEDSDCEVLNAKSMRYIVQRVEAEAFIERHPVDAFLSGIAPTLKGLSPYFLSLAKTQIYSIVQEYEMAMIMEKGDRNNRL